MGNKARIVKAIAEIEQTGQGSFVPTTASRGFSVVIKDPVGPSPTPGLSIDFMFVDAADLRAIAKFMKGLANSLDRRYGDN